MHGFGLQVNAGSCFIIWFICRDLFCKYWAYGLSFDLTELKQKGKCFDKMNLIQRTPLHSLLVLCKLACLTASSHFFIFISLSSKHIRSQWLHYVNYSDLNAARKPFVSKIVKTFGKWWSPAAARTYRIIIGPCHTPLTHLSNMIKLQLLYCSTAGNLSNILSLHLPALYAVLCSSKTLVISSRGFTCEPWLIPNKRCPL